MRAGPGLGRLRGALCSCPVCNAGRWDLDLIGESDDPEAWKTAIEGACNCPSGRLVVSDPETGQSIEPVFEQSIVVIECPARGEHRPLWV